MAYGNGSVEVSTWVGMSRHCEISYRVYPGDDTIEFTMGGHEELVMVTNEAGLRHCITEFTGALNEFEAAAAQPAPPPAADPVTLPSGVGGGEAGNGC